MITKEQAMTLRSFHGPGVYRDGSCHEYRSNGMCKTWKTRPDEFRKPVKYGLYTYYAITEVNAYEFHAAEDCPIIAARRLREQEQMAVNLAVEMRDAVADNSPPSAVLETLMGSAFLVNTAKGVFTVTVSIGNNLQQVP